MAPAAPRGPGRGRATAGAWVVARVAGAIVLAVVALAMLAAGGALTIARTSWGAERIRRLALPRVNAAIAGHADVRRLWFAGDRIALEDLRLDDPEGRPVVRVARLDVAFSPVALLRKRLSIRRVALDQVDLALRQDDRGMNLTRAIAARSPAPAPPPESPPRAGGGGGAAWGIDLGSLEVRGATVDVRDERADAPPATRHLRVEDLGLRAGGHFSGRGGELRGQLALEGDAVAPLAAPLALRVDVQGHAPPGAAAVDATSAIDLRMGASTVRLSGHVVSDAGAAAGPRADVAVERVEIAPALVRVLAPASPLIAAVTVTGRARWDGVTQRAAADLAVAAGGATVSIRGAADAGRRTVDGLTVRARDVDLARLVAEGPPSRLGFDLEAHGGGVDLPSLRGALTLEAPLGEMGGRAFGPIRVRADADRGRYRVMDLQAALPGVRVSGAGAFTDRTLGFNAAVDLRDLGELVKSVTAGQHRRHPSGGSPPRAGGHGRIELALGGNLRRPSLAVRGRLAALAWQDVRIPSARLSATIPDLGQPLAKGVSATLAIPWARLGAGAPPLRGLVVTLRSSGGQRVEGQLALAAPEPAQLAFHGGWHGQGRRLALEGDLDLTALGARVLARLRVPAAWPWPATTPVAIHVAASNVDLARVAAAARKMMPPPAFVVPAAAPPVPSDRRLRGVAALEVDVGGTAGNPTLHARADVRGLAVGGKSAGDVAATIDADRGEPLAARVELRPAGQGRPSSPAGSTAPGTPPPGSATVDVHTGFHLAALLRHPPTAEALLATPVRIEAHAAGVRLGPLAALAGYPHPVDGVAGLDLRLDGPPRSPRGQISLRLAGVATGRFPPTDATLEVTPGEHDVAARAAVTRRGTTLFSLDARLAAPPARLRDPAALAQAPVELHAALGPIDLQRAGLPPENDRRPPRVLAGRLAARIDVTGTVRAPRVDVQADATDIRLDKSLVGVGHVAASYRDRRLETDVRLQSANRGALRATSSTSIDLGYPAVTRGLDLAGLALRAHLEAQGFDVAGLSGVTPGLRSVSGLVFASVDVSGTAADPRVAGRLEWKDGGLAVTGMGEYKRVHLLAHGDRDHLVLDELAAASGDGRARVTGEGTHRPEGGYAVKAALDLRAFPAYVDGQALAAVSLAASAEAKVAAPGSSRRTRVKVAVASARLALTDAKRKQLQKLAQPADVVLADGGAPLNAAQAHKLAAVQAALAAQVAKAAREQEKARGEKASAAGEQGRAGTAAAAAADPSPARGPRPEGVIVLVDAPRNLWVSGKDANLELGLGPSFRVEITDVPRVYGDVTIKRGRVDVVGRRFDLKPDSTIRFSGPSDAPELDVGATHDNEKEKITVLVTVKGTPDHIQIAISSPDRPDLTESQLYTLVVTGRLDLGGGSAGSTTVSDRAASLAGGLLASQLQKRLAKKLPLDVLTIEAGGGLGTARVEAGRYVTSNLYVGYVGRLGADPALLQNRNAAHLEYEITSRWSFQGEYGDAKTGSADVIWTNRY